MYQRYGQVCTIKNYHLWYIDEINKNKTEFAFLSFACWIKINLFAISLLYLKVYFEEIWPEIRVNLLTRTEKNTLYIFIPCWLSNSSDYGVSSDISDNNLCTYFKSDGIYKWPWNSPLFCLSTCSKMRRWCPNHV